MRYWQNPGRELQYELNPYTSNTAIQRLAMDYVRQNGFPPIQETPYVKVDPTVAREIALAYEEIPNTPDNPMVREFYAALVVELFDQYAYVKRLVEIVPFGEGVNPYPDSPAMMEDILQNHRLQVFTGGGDHPLLTPEENFVSRGVHDFFGHAAKGFAFGPRGEENAWIEHSKMFTPAARRALTTETRGQNNWVNWGPYSKLAPEDRPYAEQKALLLPYEFCTHPVLEEAYRQWPEFVPPVFVAMGKTV